MKSCQVIRLRLWSLVGAIILCTLLFACSKQAPSVTPTQQTTAAPTVISLLTKNGTAAYRIIRPENGTDLEAQTGIDLNNSLKQLTGTDFILTSDRLTPEESIADISAVCEILIGATNRPESAQVKKELGANEYAICTIGTKIVILGSTDALTRQAMMAFLEILEEESDFTLAKDLNIREKVEPSTYLVALTNQRESMLEVYDISKGTLDASSLVWSYKLPYYNIAGTKFRHSEIYGDVALAVCGSYYGCMISYPEGKLLWYTNSAANNPHSIELLPNGVIAIASSTGNEVRFFTTASQAPAARISLGEAHGVLWDDQNQVLWALGLLTLRAYRVTLNPSGSVTVTEDTALRATAPSEAGHDLAPVYGDTNALWVTTATHVYQFNKTTKTFSTVYSGSKFLDRANIKGVGNFADGSFVFIYPDGKFKSWTSKSIFLIRNQDGKLIKETLTSETGDFYKVRVWDTRYQ